MVTEDVVERASGAPLPNAFVTVHSDGGFPYRDSTDEVGVARISAPKGEYNIYVLKDDYSEFETSATIVDNVAISANEPSRRWNFSIRKTQSGMFTKETAQ